jgi:hypothetical protein
MQPIVFNNKKQWPKRVTTSSFSRYCWLVVQELFLSTKISTAQTKSGDESSSQKR